MESMTKVQELIKQKYGTQCAISYALAHADNRVSRRYVIGDDLHRHRRLPGPRRLTPINPLTQHRKLRTRQRYSSARCLRPYKTATIKPLLEKAHPVAIMPNQLYQVTSAAPEDEDLPRQRTLVERALDQAAQARKTSAHICHSRHKPDLCISRDHPRKFSRTARTILASTALTRLRAITSSPGRSRSFCPLLSCGAWIDSPHPPHAATSTSGLLVSCPRTTAISSVENTRSISRIIMNWSSRFPIPLMKSVRIWVPMRGAGWI